MGVRLTETEDMALSAFDDKSKQPQAGDLKKTLGRASAHWDNLIAHIAAEYAPLEETWNYAGRNWGWSLRLKQKKRTVLYMTPCKVSVVKQMEQMSI
ncbi:MAG: DUF3788 family protein [Gammaproteobacteria bacterium]|jgi:hypothetical protein|nr:DUF3788 family protein [Gammaproteobacteria bacterium]|tara:strand:+ start:1311 stop:1601 length:291 start_codon:yes stop_codon:yes gene_type:complete